VKRLRSQPRIQGIVRVPSSESLLPETKRELERLAHEYGASVSWVKNTILNDAVKVRAPKYYMAAVKTKAKRRRAS
jgi:hypothetical protein